MSAYIPPLPDSLRKSFSIKHIYCCGLATHCRHLTTTRCCGLATHYCHLASTHCHGLGTHCCRLTIAVIPSVIRKGIHYMYRSTLRLLLLQLSSTYRLHIPTKINSEEVIDKDTRNITSEKGNDMSHTMTMNAARRSDGAKSASSHFVPEIWLNIIESMEYQPAMVSSLKLVNRQMYEIMNRYEHSVSSRLRAPFEYLIPKSAELVRNVPNCPRELRSIPMNSYVELKELYTRERTLVHLMTHEIFSFKHSYFNVHLPRNIDFKTADEMIIGLKANGLNLLFAINDLHGGSGDLWQVQVNPDQTQRLQFEGYPVAQTPRQKKLDFVSSLGVRDLATMMFVLHLGGSGFRELYLKRCCKPELVASIARSEFECVFREAALRHGTNFIQAVIASDKNSPGLGKDCQWVESSIELGLHDLQWYEAVHSSVSRECSIQCFCYRTLCRKLNCGMQDGWAYIWDIVSVNMKDGGHEGDEING